MKLFYVADGDEFDLLVRCNTPEEAIGLWRHYFWEEDQVEFTERLPPHIFHIPDDAIGPIAWHSIAKIVWQP